MVIPVGFKDESERLADEFQTLLDPRVRDILLGQALWLKNDCGVQLIVTCIGRTVAENQMVGGKAQSSHLIRIGKWVRGIDLRVFNMPGDTAARFVKRVEVCYPSMIYILRHNSGNGDHIHMNINRAFELPYNRSLL